MYIDIEDGPRRPIVGPLAAHTYTQNNNNTLVSYSYNPLGIKQVCGDFRGSENLTYNTFHGG